MLRRQIISLALVLISGSCTAFPVMAGAEPAGSEQSSSRPHEDAGTDSSAETPQTEDQRDAVSERKRREADRLMRHLNDAALRIGTDEEDMIPWLRLR